MEDSRIIILADEVNEQTANSVIMQLLYYNSQDKNKEIYLYINSPGGSIDSGLAIYDTMKYIEAPVHTVCVGLAASMGAFLLTCGVKRSALAHSKILIHQPRINLRGSMSLPQSDIEKRSNSLIQVRDILEDIMARNVGVTVEQMHKDCEADHWMTAQEAKDYGIIHNIIEKL